FSHPLVELARDSADGAFVADVSLAQAPGAHAAQMIAEFGDYRAFAKPSCFHCCGHASGGAPVDADVRFDGFCGLEVGGYEKKQGEMAKNHPSQSESGHCSRSAAFMPLQC